MLEEESSLTTQCGYEGYAYFSNGVYDSRHTSYTYNVFGGPPSDLFYPSDPACVPFYGPR